MAETILLQMKQQKIAVSLSKIDGTSNPNCYIFYEKYRILTFDMLLRCEVFNIQLRSCNFVFETPMLMSLQKYGR